MTYDELHKLVQERTHIGIPGAWFELRSLVGDVYTLRVVAVGPDNANPHSAHREWPGRKWLVSIRDTEAQVTNTMLKAVLTYVEHEARERFTVDGKPPYEPNH